jgi:hypothetical protein
LSFYDADNDPAGGYLATVVINFNKVVPLDGEDMALLAKSEASSFSLEIENPLGNGDGDTALQFIVWVDGGYRSATYPVSGLDLNSSYIVTGAFDGKGLVRLWINNSQTGTTSSGPYASGVLQNDQPLVLGANPELPSPPVSFLPAKVQLALLQKWNPHP